MKLLLTQANLTLMGGAERIVLKIAQHYKAEIYTAEYNKESTFPEFDDLDVQVIGKNMLSKALPYGRVMQGLNYGLSFYNLKVNEDYDVINAHIAPSHWIKHRNDRVIWYCHTPLRDIYDLYQYRLSLKKPYQRPIHILGARGVRIIDKSIVKNIEFIFANSSNTESRIRKYYGRKDAVVLNGGIDYKLYKNMGDEKYFFYPSRISQNKRQDYAIRAFSIFKRKVKGYKLILSGAVSKDDFYAAYYNKIREEAKKVGDVQIVENPSDSVQRKLFAHSSAVLYAPINEDYGLVPLESMASGKPVISVNEGGPRSTILDGKTGFLVNSESEMADKMHFIADNPQAAKELGRAGIERIKRHYSWERFFETFDKKVRQVAKM
ncbi:MAG: glycosyltransferase [Candidatus Micrarchaeaceae archaeon]